MKNRNHSINIVATAFFIFAATISTAQNSIPSRPKGPCDIYEAAGYPCVTAHSTTRALYASYNGPLYQVMRQSDGKTLDISVVQPSAGDAGGYANAAAHDDFCANTLSWITIIYDQSGKGNHLYQAPPGTFKGPAKGAFNTLPIADMAPITIDGHKVYGVYIMPGMGFRNNNASEIAINDEPEGIYYVINGKHYDSGCCFDYGNSSTNGKAVGTGTMETTYFGTATAWGSGNGPGPWIMADFEAGLFSGYNAKQNNVPTIDSWRFVTAIVNGGGGNKWSLRGGDAQNGELTTFYSGVRPGTPNSSDYFPMNKKGGILMGNGGDNGNGSAGTFYEGVMTTGYPSDATTDAVQANIVAAKYNVQPIEMSRATTFAPTTTQEISVTFTNTTQKPLKGAKISLSFPKGWKAVVAGTSESTKNISSPIASGASFNTTFKVTSPLKSSAGFLNATIEFENPVTRKLHKETYAQRIRNSLPIKINEVRLGTTENPSNQFIELYNASDADVDLSNWKIINTQSQWASVNAATLPEKTKLKAGGFYLLGLSSSGLAAPATKGSKTINVISTTGLEVGQKINIDGETRTIANLGTAASPATTIFIPVSTGPWLTFPAGTSNLPVSNAAGFEVGQKISIDLGGSYEIATVTSVGKAATQTTLAAPGVEGATTIKVAANSNITVGDTLTINTGTRMELVTVKSIVNVVAAPTGGGFGQNRPSTEAGEIELEKPLRFNHIQDVDVWSKGTGISFTPATKFEHKSGDAVQALGIGITLDSPLARNHEYGASIVNPMATEVGYQGTVVPNQWYGSPFSASAGSIALFDASGQVLADAMVYGSQQSSSSANGTIASPEIATLEGVQSQGGCIVVAPRASSGDGVSRGRFPDGNDTDSNCNDFLLQSPTALSAASTVGATNIKVASVTDLTIGLMIKIDTGTYSETAIITTVGTSGGTTVGTATTAGATVIPVASAAGFAVGQTITIDSGANLESAVIASISGGGRGGAFGGGRGNTSITIAAPLTYSHTTGAQVSGSGITLASPLTKEHNKGVQIAGNLPTPGTANRYFK